MGSISQYTRMKPVQQWLVMRTDVDINPVTNETEEFPQCVKQFDQPLSDAELAVFRKQYNDPNMWVQEHTVYQ